MKNIIGKREFNILKNIAKGDTNAEIAKKLKLSVSNTNMILNRLFFKTETRNRAHLIAWAYQQGILS